MFRDDLLEGRKIELGAELVICGRREAVLQETTAEFDAAHPGKTGWYACDIRDAEAVEEMIAAVWQDGPLDVLVNNAAGNFIAKSETLSPRAVDAVLGIVLHGSAYATLAVTTYAWTGSPYVLPSAMAKAGVLAMTRSLAAEWGKYGIRLNAIAPGPFPTKGAWERLVPDKAFEQAWLKRIPLGRVGEHQELADLAVYLVAPGAGYMTGEVVTIDGGEWLKGAAQFGGEAPR
jgi:NAD(P)-dependent dehydrogenase (short-subunit alcohol dehydrogenase family)